MPEDQHTLQLSSLSLCIMSLHCWSAAGAGSKHASSTAEVYRSRVLKHTSFSPNCCSMVSPWIDTRSLFCRAHSSAGQHTAVQVWPPGQDRSHEKLKMQVALLVVRTTGV